MLTGCWDGLDIKNVAIVTGTGISKSEEGYRISIQVLNPGGGKDGESKSEPKTGSTVLEHTAKTIHGFSRDFTRIIKRRLVFSHNRVWIVHDSLAKENLLLVLDFLQRNEFPRLNSYLLITQDDPADLLRAPPLLKSISTTELFEGIKSSSSASNYASNDIRETLRMLTEPPNTAYLPIVRIGNSADTPTLEITGTAVFNRGRMTGKLDTDETIGLLWLWNQVKDISISAEGASKHPLQVQVKGTGTSVETSLRGERLSSDVNIRLRGTVAEIPPQIEVTETLMDELGEQVSATVTKQVEATLKALQKKYHTDITGIGLNVYRKYPKEWHKVEPRWDEIFSHAKVTVHVKAEIYHPGLVKNTFGKTRKKPEMNPFLPRTQEKE
jgi:spore germination protein KC